MMRQFFFQAHWLLGITAGLVLAIMGVSGALISFEDEIGEWLAPQVVAPGIPATGDLTPDRVIAAVERDNPGYYVSRLDWETDRHRSHNVRLSKVEDSGRRQGQVDRATALWLGPPGGAAFLDFVNTLHRWLALPGGGNGIGRQITGFSALALVFFALSGLYLRWPKNVGDWRAWFVLDLRKSGRNFWRALHVVTGTWVLVFYLLSALTGLWWSYDWYKRGVTYALTGKAAESEARREKSSGAPRTAIDPAWAGFQRVAGNGYAWVRITQPKPGTPVRAVNFDARRADARHARQTDRYSFDPVSAKLKKRDLYARRPLGKIIIGSVLEIHRGAFFGMPGRIVMLLTSLTMPLFTITGYLLYLSRRKRKRAGASADAIGTAGAGDMLIAYASQTGGSEIMARNAAIALQRGGKPARLVPLSRLTPEILAGASTALFVVSTYGEGDAPDMARGFERKTMRAPMALDHVRYGVLALGDREYPEFCAFGGRVDAWLAGSGAQPLFPMIAMDNDDTDAEDRWHGELVRQGASEASRGQQKVAVAPWTLVERHALNAASPHAKAFHLRLEPADDMPDWQAGDIVEVQPCNDPARVEAWLADWQGAGIDDATRAQLATALLPAPGPHATSVEAMAALRRLPRREYSAASIPADGTLDLVVRQVSGPDGSLGIGSGWLTEHLAPGATVALRIRPNPGFRTTSDETPLILIGNGTGIAGLRAHLRARAHEGQGGHWLLFGERHRAHDSFFDAELRAWVADGTLARVDRAFSRDADCGRYVQGLVREHGDEIADWIDRGATLLICGSLTGMAKGVNDALTDIVGDEGVDELRDAQRYKLDVY